MSLVEEYRMIMLDRVYPTIEAAMPAVGEGLKKAINDYSAQFDGPRSRPKLFGDGTYTVFYDALSVTVWNRTRMQGADYGIPEVDFVEEGLPNYNMPGPRPFMEPARDEYVASGEPDMIIQAAINAAGLG